MDSKRDLFNGATSEPGHIAISIKHGFRTRADGRQKYRGSYSNERRKAEGLAPAVFKKSRVNGHAQISNIKQR